jgi:hypothetical protein
MSHFCVVVIGDKWQEQLAPYHEFESTGVINKFICDVDITDEFFHQVEKEKKHQENDPFQYTLDYYEYPVVSRIEDVDRENEHKWGFVVISDGQVKQVVRRTNPNSKWDWYQLGGRWQGYFKLKPGAQGLLGEPGVFETNVKPGYADQARKRDIDWEGMRKEAGDSAAKFWDSVYAVSPSGWESWDSIRNRISDDKLARDTYNNQPGRKALIRSKNSDLFWVDDSVLVPRNIYISDAENAAGISFALVKDGQWIERGEMGRWGQHTDTVVYTVWCTKIRELIDNLDDDVLLSAVDCHI